MVVSEIWSLATPRDMRALVRMAAGAEQAGIDGVMLSEHIVLGPSAGAGGVMENPRDYAYPGNQPPDMPWPSSVVLLSAIAAVTERLRLVAGAIIAPLRHPLLLAKELGTLDLLAEGRLVVLPTVSWHADEYDALGVPFHQRGAILDEQLEVLARCWAGGARGRDRGVVPAGPAGRSTLTGVISPSTTSGSSRVRTDPTVLSCGSAASGCTRPCCAASSGGGRDSTLSALPRARTWRS
jgi:alkanesulfonate monooxygenase SsuD/methylene tetrahydromethanopterin reductase-like flavin-dependent oxidoreductase (luciferase family)